MALLVAAARRREGSLRIVTDCAGIYEELCEVRSDCWQDEIRRSSSQKGRDRTAACVLLMIKLLCVCVWLHDWLVISTQTTQYTLNQGHDDKQLCSCSLHRIKGGSSTSSIREHMHIHSFSVSVAFFSLRANKLIPTSNHSKYLCTVTAIQTFWLLWKTRWNYTLMYNLGNFLVFALNPLYNQSI